MKRFIYYTIVALLMLPLYACSTAVTDDKVSTAPTATLPARETIITPGTPNVDTKPQEHIDVSEHLDAPISFYRVWTSASDQNQNPVKITSPDELITYCETYFSEGDSNTRGYSSDDDVPFFDPESRSIISDIFENEKYNETFFSESFLVFIEIVEPSGSIRHSISSVTADSERLTINVHSLQPYVQTDDMAHWIIALEMDSELAELDVEITRSGELWIPGSEQWPDTPGSLEGKDPEDEAYREECFLAAVDAFWRRDVERLKKYYFFPDDIEVNLDSFIEQFGEDIFDAVLSGDVVPDKYGSKAGENREGLSYRHPTFGERDLRIEPEYRVVGGQLKLRLSMWLQTA